MAVSQGLTLGAYQSFFGSTMPALTSRACMPPSVTPQPPLSRDTSYLLLSIVFDLTLKAFVCRVKD